MLHNSNSPKIYSIANIALPLRIALMGVALVLGFVAIAGTVRYAINNPSNSSNSNSSGSNNSTIAPDASAPDANPSTAPSITQPQINSGSNTNTTARCNTAQRSSFTAQYNSQTSNENSRHQSVLNFLTSTGASAAAFAAENTTHQNNLNSINSQYQNNLRSIGC